MITIRNANGDLKTCTEAELPAALRKGWLPVRDDQPAFDSATQQLVAGAWEHTETEWVLHWTVEPLPVRDSLKQRIAERRWEEEVKGVTVTLPGGRTLRLATDATSQAKLTGLMVIASAQPVSLGWKGADGVFVQIDNADVQAMAAAAFTHVQTCFGRESQLLAGLEADDLSNLTATQAAIEAFWPA